MFTQLTIGDWSRDGHEKTRTVIISANMGMADIRRYYAKGSLSLNYAPREHTPEPTDDVMDFVACDYEDISVPSELAEKLIAVGIKPATWLDTGWDIEDALYEYQPSPDKYESEYSIGDYENFAKMYLEIAKLACPSLEYRIVQLDNIDIGGYGIV